MNDVELLLLQISLETLVIASLVLLLCAACA
jgi:hypothetical protein